MSKNESRIHLLRLIAIEAGYGSGREDVKEGETNNFIFRRIQFEKLFNFDFDGLLRDVVSNKDFSLRVVPPTQDATYRKLGLHFIPDQLISFRADRRLSLLRTGFDVETILPEADSTGNSPEHLESYQHRKKTISTLFQLLREKHCSGVIHPSIPEDLQCGSLKATLRPYQTRAVQWLFHREIAKDAIPHNFVRIKSFNSPDFAFFCQPDYLEVTDSQPSDILLPTGGILADEMGLGKTVEMLALFLLNKRNLSIDFEIAEQNLSGEPPDKRPKQDISCLCGKESTRNVVQCCLCFTFQHTRCTRKYAEPSDDDSSYLCPKCWEGQPVIKSNATIIVSPATIRQQWNSEIARHTQGVNVFTYGGVVGTGWISPIELARFDIILTDYNVLQKEINFSHDMDTQLTLRNKKKYVRKTSPLNMIEWWRVVLDEAQMVESGVTKSAQMVQKLAAIHRWAVTGTPIQKSIDDIRGLLEFLDVIPFFKEHIWSSLSGAFQKGDRKPLLNVLSKVMWRTCKANVLEELGIPPQAEKVHYLVLSDVQRLFYRGQHSASMWELDNVIRKFPVSMPLSQLDPRSLKKIFEPLRKLRQDCTVPVIFKKMEQSQVKKCLTPKELVAHLISTYEIESKNHLRCMVSSINGQAALRIVRKEFRKAVELYKSVLELAEKYNEIISVDTLLQIHALHNLVEIHSMCSNVPDLGVDAVKEYKTCCDKLEWKYLSIYNDNFVKAQTTFHQAQKAYSETAANLPKDKTVCWQSLLVTLKQNNLDVRFLDKINEEFALTNADLMANFRMIEGISYFITNWVDKMFRLRDDVLNRFQKFYAYVENIKPQSELTDEGKQIIESFVKITFDCHLFELQDTSKKGKKKNKRKLRFCDLCKAKKCLDEYECVIFSKKFDENRDNMEGSWKPTIQESICRTILRFTKASDINDEDVVEANEFLKMLECIKTEYKEFIKLWIEIEYTVKAYDEINMCKLRLQLYDETQNEDEDDQEEKANYQIKQAEVDYYLEELANDYFVAESQFQKKLARLKYIRHLESNEDPGICPICKHEPDAKYSMLQCGHHMCMMCLVGMKEYQRNVLTCAVCRFRQKYEDVYFVTRKVNDPSLDIIEVQGQHSSKVEEIVREVLRLKKSESSVKIIIFSHWYTIVRVIAQALLMNNVTVAFKKNVTQAINSFKQADSDITCLLLMLSQGSKGLNLTEATHVFLVEPILNPGEEQQAIGRVHRIGQTKPTTVHRFIMKETIEETIYNTVANDDQGKWDGNDITINNIKSLFALDD